MTGHASETHPAQHALWDLNSAIASSSVVLVVALLWIAKT